MHAGGVSGGGGGYGKKDPLEVRKTHSLIHHSITQEPYLSYINMMTVVEFHVELNKIR